MYTITKEYSNTIIIKKSVFIATLLPIKTVDDATEKLKNIRKKYYDATHNCYSYILTDIMNNQTFKASDDNEPHQTAGVVIMDVLKKNELTNILCVVTRYFGGIKLGAGGLVRAYSQATSEVLKDVEKEEIIKKCIIEITLSYSDVNKVLTFFLPNVYVNSKYEESVVLEYLIRDDDFFSLKEKIIDITKGQAAIKRKESPS